MMYKSLGKLSVGGAGCRAQVRWIGSNASLMETQTAPSKLERGLSSSAQSTSPSNRSISSSANRKDPTLLKSLAHTKNLAPIHTPLKGRALLNFPSLNKGTAFPAEEREAFGLTGLLPYEVHTLDIQCDRAWGQLCELEVQGLAKPSEDLAKYTFLTSLRDQNHILYYNLVLRHLDELLPIIYTPTVGLAIQRYSKIWRRPEGLFLAYPDRLYMRNVMKAFKRPKDVDLIVVTDSEGILGIGDQGVGGVLISVGKGNIYTLGAGIHPSRILPVVLDCGTDNEALLNDPLYTGVRRPRLRGKEYDTFVDKFCRIVREEYPNAFLHFEDFGVSNAGRVLARTRPLQSCFNDDMQGTAAVVVAALMSACKVKNTTLKDERICIYGLGTAGLGIADGIRNSLIVQGLTPEEASNQFYCVDRPGLLTTEHLPTLRPGQEHFVRPKASVKDWASTEGHISLLDVVKNAKPTILIGCSTMAGAFNEDVIKEMAKHTDRPIVFPLSNPTSLAEATPADINKWTNGKALITTGSPFPPIKLASGKLHNVANSNNALVYPGLGLGTIISKASQLTDSMITAGISALAELSPALTDPEESLLPSMSSMRRVSVIIATAVANQALKDGVSRVDRTDPWTEGEIRKLQWDPVYRPLELVESI